MSDREILSVSRLSTLLTCMRKHYWRYELGLRKVAESDALRFGSAWHRSMEVRATGADIETAIAAAIGERSDLDELQLATLAGMLTGYYHHYKNDTIVAMQPEVEFRMPLAGSRTFDVGGKIDGLGILDDGRKILMEHKTAGFDLSPASNYWMRLIGNMQVMQYLIAARDLGWDIETILYDVARKPMIKPCCIPTLDANGYKIVNDTTGTRVFKKNGEPRETADQEKGYTTLAALETPAQFNERLTADTMARPEFYYARREVPVLADDLEAFQIQRLELSRLILLLRGASRRASKPEYGWPRNIGENTCKYCDFTGFCLQNCGVDMANPPSGFRIGAINPELTQPTTEGDAP